MWDVQPCAIRKVVLECRSTGPKNNQARYTSCISIKEGIHHGIDHLPQVRRHCFGQSFRLRPLRLSSPRRKGSAGNTHRLGHTKSALLHRMWGSVTARCSFCTSCGAPVGTPGPSAVSQPVQPPQVPAQPLAPASPMPPAPKQKEPEVLKCPKCGSALVTTGERAIQSSGVSWAPAAP